MKYYIIAGDLANLLKALFKNEPNCFWGDLMWWNF